MQILSLNRLIMFNTPIGITHSYSDLDNNSSQPFFHGASFWLLKVDQLFRFLLQHARMSTFSWNVVSFVYSDCEEKQECTHKCGTRSWSHFVFCGQIQLTIHISLDTESSMTHDTMAVCVCGLIKKSTIFASRKQMLSIHGTLGAPTWGLAITW